MTLAATIQHSAGLDGCRDGSDDGRNIDVTAPIAGVATIRELSRHTEHCAGSDGVVERAQVRGSHDRYTDVREFPTNTRTATLSPPSTRTEPSNSIDARALIDEIIEARDIRHVVDSTTEMPVPVGTPSASVFSGAAGVGLALAELARRCERPDWSATARAWSEVAARSDDPNGFFPSDFSGRGQRASETSFHHGPIGAHVAVATCAALQGDPAGLARSVGQISRLANDVDVIAHRSASAAILDDASLVSGLCGLLATIRDATNADGANTHSNEPGINDLGSIHHLTATDDCRDDRGAIHSETGHATATNIDDIGRATIDSPMADVATISFTRSVVGTSADERIGRAHVVLASLIAERLARLDTWIETQPICEMALSNLGAAHGWVGLLDASLRASTTLGIEAPAAMLTRLAELATFMEIRRGEASWPVAAGHPAARCGGWCNGAAGHVSFWCRVHEWSGDADHLDIAVASAATMIAESSAVPNLCCGSAGKVLAALTLFRTTRERRWIDAALTSLDEAARLRGERTPPMIQLDRVPLSVYKGDLGVAVAAAAVLDPERPIRSFP